MKTNQTPKKERKVSFITKTKTSSFVIFTPQLATEALLLNTMNRKSNQASINRLAQSMVNGKFLPTNIGVGIDSDGVLTDGAHRLKACVKANVPVEILLVTGLKPVTRLLVDSGIKRSTAGGLQMLGIGIEYKPNGKVKFDFTKMISQSAGYIMLHKQNKFGLINSVGKTLTIDEIIAFIQENEEEFMESAKTINRLIGDCKYVQLPHLLFIYMMHKFSNHSRITSFINILSGKEISSNLETCPVFKLKDALIENSSRKSSKYSTVELMGLLIEASNKFMDRIEMKPKAKLHGRSNDSAMINVRITSELNEKGVDFFNSVPQDKKGLI